MTCVVWIKPAVIVLLDVIKHTHTVLKLSRTIVVTEGFAYISNNEKKPFSCLIDLSRAQGSDRSFVFILYFLIQRSNLRETYKEEQQNNVPWELPPTKKGWISVWGSFESVLYTNR